MAGIFKINAVAVLGVIILTWDFINVLPEEVPRGEFYWNDMNAYPESPELSLKSQSLSLNRY
uniref:Uncharacterized protein n=1 Tax=Timema poppense TaxID=170557 RepID=A0A7R9CQC1_TIMPO|nr:unnamed protein product [Timema poppensis]